MPTHFHQQGFTLIEVMITVAIVGMLAAVAMPGYTRHILKGNRSDGFAVLNEIMQAQERFAVDNGTYTNNLTLLGYAAAQPSAEGYYTVTADICTTGTMAQCVRLTATAVGNQTNDINDNSAIAALNPGDMAYNSRGIKVGWK